MSDSQTLVVKLGTSVLTGGSRRLNRAHIVELVRQCAQLHAAGHRIVIVTSGAIAERVVVVYHALSSVVRNEQKESMMTKADLVAQIAARANMTKAAAERSLNAMLESVQEMLAEDGKLTLTGFGTFVAETRQERQGRNPRTGDVITIAASKVVRFRPGKMLKDALNK